MKATGKKYHDAYMVVKKDPTKAALFAVTTG